MAVGRGPQRPTAPGNASIDCHHESRFTFDHT
jgi:hypothetical protein